VSHGCSREPGDGPPLPTTTSTSDTSSGTSGLPLWVYSSQVAEGTSSQQALDGQLLFELDGMTFSGKLFGPTLVAEGTHEIFYQLRNNTTETVGLSAVGVDVVDAPDIAVNDSQTTVIQTREATVTAYEAAGRQGLGLTGLVTVRDPLAFPVNDLDEHVNLVLFEPEASATLVNECAVQESLDTGGGCPRMVPAPGGFTVLLAQRLTQAYTPPGARHGGPPNEFLTTTYDAASVLLTKGNDVRLNVFNMTSSTHTMTFGGLPFGDNGAALGEVTLAPGEGRQYTATQLAETGEFDIGCLDCDLPKAQIGRVAIVD